MGALFRGGCVIEVGELIFPKSWPDKIIFLIHHLRVNNSISFLIDIKSWSLSLNRDRVAVSQNVFNVFTWRVDKLKQNYVQIYYYATKTIHPLLAQYSSTKWGEGRVRLIEGGGANWRMYSIGLVFKMRCLHIPLEQDISYWIGYC